MAIQDLLDRANDRLKSGRIGVMLEVQGKGDWLYLRGTFPPRPGSQQGKPKQTRIALKLQALDAKSIKNAEMTARQVGLDLNRGLFDWRKWSDYEDPNQPTLQNAVRLFERKWWTGKDRADGSKKNTWRIYQALIDGLPERPVVGLDLLENWVIGHSGAKTEMRRHYLTVAKGIAKAANLPIENFKELNSDRPLKPVNPRDLPSDEELLTMRESLTEEGWRWVFGIMICYGLRNHEVFFLDTAEFPDVRVRDDSKTGSRMVTPLLPEWAEQWSLEEVIYPDRILIVEDRPINKLGNSITRGIKLRLGMLPYNIRHCFARRCFEQGIREGVACKLMGHSLLRHERTYQTWIGERAAVDEAKRILRNRR